MMLWRAWSRWQRTSRPPSDIWGDWLRAEFGSLWLQWADDLDNAVAEFGLWVQGKVDEYVDDRAKQAREAKIMVDRNLLGEWWDEAWQYYVKSIVRRYRGDATTGGVTLWQKPATYDAEIDADMSTDDVRLIVVSRGEKVAGGRM